MKKQVLIIIVACNILLVPLVSASSVTRSFSSDTVYTDTLLTVYLDVVVDGNEMIYAIVENIPPGWKVYDNKTGNFTEQNMLKWLYYSNTTQASNIRYDYILISPDNPGSNSFSGTYIFEGMGSEVPVVDITSPISVIYGAGDLNNDNCVDLGDLSVVSLSFGDTESSPGDANSDGIVDVYDLSTVGKNFDNEYSSGACNP
jgi:hypothetical protein